MKKKLKKRKKSVKFFSKKTLKVAAQNSIFKDMAERKELPGHVPMKYKFSYHATAPSPAFEKLTLPATIGAYQDYFHYDLFDGKIDSSAARQAMANAVGYGCGQSNSPDDRQYLIQGLLIEEIKRLQRENFQLKLVTKNYLEVFDKEKSQNADLHTKQA